MDFVALCSKNIYDSWEKFMCWLCARNTCLVTDCGIWLTKGFFCNWSFGLGTEVFVMSVERQSWDEVLIMGLKYWSCDSCYWKVDPMSEVWSCVWSVCRVNGVFIFCLNCPSCLFSVRRVTEVLSMCLKCLFCEWSVDLMADVLVRLLKCWSCARNVCVMWIECVGHVIELLIMWQNCVHVIQLLVMWEEFFRISSWLIKFQDQTLNNEVAWSAHDGWGYRLRRLHKQFWTKLCKTSPHNWGFWVSSWQMSLSPGQWGEETFLDEWCSGLKSCIFIVAVESLQL